MNIEKTSYYTIQGYYIRANEYLQYSEWVDLTDTETGKLFKFENKQDAFTKAMSLAKSGYPADLGIPVELRVAQVLMADGDDKTILVGKAYGFSKDLYIGNQYNRTRTRMIDVDKTNES